MTIALARLVCVLVAPAPDDSGPSGQSLVEVLDGPLAEEVVSGRAQDLAAEYGSCAVIRRPAEIVLVTGDAKPVTTHFSNGYGCPWCATGVPDGAPGCPNPACVAQPGMGVECVRAVLDRLREREARQADDKRRVEFSRWYAEESRRAREAVWAEVSAEAGRRGACLECLCKSNWQFGTPRYVRHRTADFHTRESR